MEGITSLRSQRHSRTVCIGLILCLSLTCCGKKEASEKPDGKTPSKFISSEYYPLSEKSYWSYDWVNLRGDAWRGSIAVTGSRQEEKLRVFIVLDTTERYNQFEVYQSAYLWDADGLKHLYRASDRGDCTAFNPPRLVLPAELILNRPQSYNYRCEVYSREFGLKYAKDIHLENKLVRTGACKVKDKIYNDCLTVESNWTETLPNSTPVPRRKATWLARGVGPVQIDLEIPPSSPQLEGESKGILSSCQIGTAN